jgi:uncharacterized paraquat-inducible protein A
LALALFALQYGRVNLVAARGDQATALVILASIVIPLVVLAVVSWVFWKHRHDD